jgi:hypothetical protein
MPDVCGTKRLVYLKVKTGVLLKWAFYFVKCDESVFWHQYIMQDSITKWR